jgi:hypothetical protein
MVKAIMSAVKSCIRVKTNLSKPVTTHDGLRQGDALVCVLFNIALEKVIGG